MQEELSGRKIYTVSELNNGIKYVLEDAYPDIWVEGEISGLKTYASGHTYFYLKDAESRLAAVLFQGFGRALKFALEEGIKVILRGRLTAYPKRGDYQLIVTFAEPAGIGPLQLAFEQLKSRLKEEGLFDDSRKRPIPVLVQRIGVVTSPDGAALRDILSVASRRFSSIQILIYPARVQGDEAKYDISDGIRYLSDNHPELDVLMVGRGGGSYEDLWPFNEEIVARAISSSRIPVISCVGHETDFTIADFAADLRAPTPSAAAELVVSSKQELQNTIGELSGRLERSMRGITSTAEERLRALSKARVLQRPDAVMETYAQQVDGLSDSLSRAFSLYFERKVSGYELLAQKLGLVSPLNTLSRGYAICREKATGRVLRSARGLKRGDTVTARLAEGSFTASVENTAVTEKSNEAKSEL